MFHGEQVFMINYEKLSQFLQIYIISYKVMVLQKDFLNILR